ncbi:MAG: hypothetical protein ACYC9S_09335 [Leptospirales bacterium]
MRTVGQIFEPTGKVYCRGTCSPTGSVYAPVDLGSAITAGSADNPVTAGNPSSLTAVQGGSLYGELGTGINVRLLTIEAKVAYLPTPGIFGGSSFFFPISFGFDL